MEGTSATMKERIPPKRGSAVWKREQAIRAFALGFPEAYEEFPWGERAFKVNAKVFTFVTASPDGIHMSLKLPDAGREALLLPFTEPTGYGMGKHGWVSSRFGSDDTIPMPLVKRWIEESYRTIAPKKLVARLDGAPAPAPKRKTRKKA